MTKASYYQNKAEDLRQEALATEPDFGDDWVHYEEMYTAFEKAYYELLKVTNKAIDLIECEAGS